MRFRASLSCRVSVETVRALRIATPGCPRGHACSAGSQPLQARPPPRAPGAPQAWRAAPCSAAGLAGAASPPVSGRGSQTHATNFLQVSGPGSAAPLSVSAPRSVRPRVCRGRAPLSRLLPGPWAGWVRDPGTGGRGLKKTRHHLGSQVCAGAAPACPSRGPFRAQAVALRLPRWLEPSVPAQVSVATCECRRRQRALGEHVQPRLCVSVCVYILGVRRRRSRGLQEGGGTSGVSSRSPSPT